MRHAIRYTQLLPSAPSSAATRRAIFQHSSRGAEANVSANDDIVIPSASW
jgi:hypothetical protein